ncbi:hypothetical protein RN001_006021 [Aquatica leii]|uniref:Uncharacterized protein n=1 Tax=Aquatica leii TaxID=1421715 RepID=A0AAN7PCL1_9COLE|nr:hypothetical protein RN001_006021 [Aquatica leii]
MLEIDELTEDEDFLELLNLNLYPRIPRVIRERPNHFVKWKDDEFKNKFRLSKPVVRYLIDKISDNIKSLTNKKCMYAFTLQDICDSSLKLIDTFTGFPKSVSDTRIFFNSDIYKSIIINTNH